MLTQFQSLTPQFDLKGHDTYDRTMYWEIFRTFELRTMECSEVALVQMSLPIERQWQRCAPDAK